MPDQVQAGPSYDEVARLLSGEDPPAATPTPETEHSEAADGGLRTRLNEEIARRRQAEQQVDTMIRKGVAQPAPQANQGLQIDPTLEAQVAPLLERNTQQILEALGPLIQYSRRQVGLETVEGNIPGYKDSLATEVDKLYAGLSDEEKVLYDSEVGAEALAARVLAKRLETAQQRPSASSVAVQRAHTIGRSPAVEPQKFDARRLDEMASRMPHDEFATLVEAIKEGRLRQA